MNAIKRDDIASIRCLDDIVAIFKEKGFTESKKESDTEIRIKISEDPTFLSIFKINGVADVPKYQKYLDIRTEYLTLVTHDFENLIFVKKEFTKLDTEWFRKFRINKSKITNTSLNKINGLLFNDITSFDNLFDRKEVVKQFYDEFIKYRKLLIDNISGLKTEIDKERYAQIIVDRLIFLYFIQKKKLLNGDENYLPRKLKENKGDFFNNFLCPLFFKGLSVKGYKDRKLGDIPYLNGGLFRQKKCEQVKISISDEVFEKILTFFDSWNWYVDERADYGEENSISPEILGHIFEKTVNQKESGAYYTPEIITSYISETTIYPACLKKVNSRFEQNYSTIIELLDRNSSKEIWFLYNDALKNLTIVDNACGSGAFLIAAQIVLLDLYSQVIFLLKDDERLIEEIEEYNQTHDPKLALELSSAQEFRDDHRWNYYIKRMIITNNLYGVDIEEGAGEIGKLRLWLSMIAHVPENISSVEPLPNIEYNIRCGNSLLGYTSAAQIVEDEDLTRKSKKKIVNANLFSVQYSLDTYQPDSIFHLYHERNQLIRQFKNADDSINAANLKEIIDQKTFQYNQVLNKKLFEETVFEKGVDISEDAFAELKPFHWIMEFSDIFERGGFDVVIGNPPYIKANKELIILKNQRKVLSGIKYYKFLYKKWDLFVPFIERGIILLRNGGLISFIISDGINREEYASKLRAGLTQETVINSLDFFPGLELFQDVGINNTVFLIQKTIPVNGYSPCRRVHIDNSLKNFKILRELKYPFDPNEVFNPQYDDISLNELKNELFFDEIFYISKGMVLNSDEKTDKAGFTKDDLVSVVTDNIPRQKFVESDDIQRYSSHNNKYLEYGTARVPDQISRPTFPELYVGSRIYMARKGEAHIFNDRTLTDQRVIIFKPWDQLETIDNRSVNSQRNRVLKKYSLKPQQLTSKSSKYDIKFFLSILNSHLLKSLIKSRYKRDKFDITPDVFREIPIPKISFKTAPNIRKKRLSEMIGAYDNYLDNDDDKSILILIDNALYLNIDESDVVHDFLAYLVEQLISLNQDKVLINISVSKEKINLLLKKLANTDKLMDKIIGKMYGIKEDHV
jgi:hypothetical protein